LDSLDWSKAYVVLSISRLYLHHTLGFPLAVVESLTDEDMSRIADILVAQRFDHEFEEEVRFTTSLVLAEKRSIS
jgi:hypothetical protein